MSRKAGTPNVARSSPSLWWTISLLLLRALALLFAVARCADLLFFGAEYQRASAQFHTNYQIANWLLVFIACYPRFLFRISSLLAVPLLVGSIVSAFEWHWLALTE